MIQSPKRILNQHLTNRSGEAGIKVSTGNDRHGFGVYRFYTGDVYSGEWSKGQSHGCGIHTCEDGSRYVREFKWVLNTVLATTISERRVTNFVNPMDQTCKHQLQQ